jgi:acetyltransferase-like isoleucine patch superfamily enzyme
MFSSFKKIIAVINCLILQGLLPTKLRISFPSICFSLWPFQVSPEGSIIVGRRAIISNHCDFISLGRLKIGNNFCINKYSRIVAHEEILIGNNVTIAQFVSILDHDHAFICENEHLVLNGYSTVPIKIGDNVWIGDKVTILKGVNIGNNVIIGANSVVTKDIENNCVAVGNPCRKVRSL